MSIHRILFLGILSWLFSGALAIGQQAVDSNYVFSGYTERLEYFRSLPPTRGTIVFLGNSLTEAGRWNDILPGRRVINRGISGDISFGVLARLDEVLAHRPKKIFLMIGVNDLKRGIPTKYIIQNYQRIVAAIRKQSPRTAICLNSVLPVNPDILIESFQTVKNSDIAVLNSALRELASVSKRTVYIDLHPAVADERGYLRKEISPDGIHLEVAAYPALVDYLRRQKAL